MWLATTFGFYDLHVLQNGRVAARGHLRQDLENLRELLDLEGEIESIAGSSAFACQLILTQDQLLQLVAIAAAWSTYDQFSTAVFKTGDQGNKSSAYQELERELIRLQLAELGDRLTPSPEDKERHEAYIRENLPGIIKQSCLCGVDDSFWEVTRISWTAEEWEELSPRPGYCYVEVYEHSAPPLDYIYVMGVRKGSPEYIACYEGDTDYFELTTWRLEGDLLDLPEHVKRV
ncbi:MAG: hypothetical protein ACI8UO_005561 [Verrucomicrobiales bacterium]|jgi:hypothetical protein